MKIFCQIELLMRDFKISTFLFFVLIIFINSTPCFCQVNGQIALRKINEQNGLSDNNVTCVHKDNKDFVWIGTASGLNLINGLCILFLNTTAIMQIR